MEINNYTMLYHRSTYYFKKIRNFLEGSGVKNVKRYNWKDTENSYIDDHTQAYFPYIYKENSKLIFLNVECYKL